MKIASTNPFFERLAKNPRLIEDELRGQSMLMDSPGAIHALSKAGTLLYFNPGERVLTQSDHGCDIFFLVQGSAEVRIHNRPLSKRREAGTHVGEMCLIDPRQRRSASVVAVSPLVAVKVCEQDFTRIASKHPLLWRSIARELAQRLRDRSDHIRPLNEVPLLFIGSSKEGKPIGELLKKELGNVCKIHLWTDDVFVPSTSNLESLVRFSRKADFAVFVVRGDDLIKSRNAVTRGPRDNIVFELGLFTGALGRDRTFLLKRRSDRIKIPSDLGGVVLLEYAARADLKDPAENLTKIIQEKWSS